MSYDPSNNVDDFLFGGGGKSFPFDKEGDAVVGVITDARMAQQTSLEGNKPLTWEDGQPKMQLVVTLQTDLRDSDEDEGIRRIFAKGGKFEAATGRGTSMKDAIAEACRKAGLKKLEAGQKLTVGYTGTGKVQTRGHNPPKLYSAKIEAAAASVSASELFDD